MRRLQRHLAGNPPFSLQRWGKLILVFWSQDPGLEPSPFYTKCWAVSQRIYLTLRWRQMSAACQESNKWECMVWVVRSSAGRFLESRIWPKACCVEWVSAIFLCFCWRIDSPKRTYTSQCDKWHLKIDVLTFAKLWHLTVPFQRGNGGVWASFMQGRKLGPGSRAQKEHKAIRTTERKCQWTQRPTFLCIAFYRFCSAVQYGKNPDHFYAFFLFFSPHPTLEQTSTHTEAAQADKNKEKKVEEGVSCEMCGGTEKENLLTPRSPKCHCDCTWDHCS